MNTMERAVEAAKAWIKTYSEERDLGDPTNIIPAPVITDVYDPFLEISHVPVDDVNHLMWFVESEADVYISRPTPEDEWFTKWTLHIKESP